ncbi:hypothetical protein CFP56_039864, partial [Quercus suber]
MFGGNIDTCKHQKESCSKYTTMDINVKEILPKGLPKIQDGVLALNNIKTVVEIKGLEWNSETK